MVNSPAINPRKYIFRAKAALVFGTLICFIVFMCFGLIYLPLVKLDWEPALCKVLSVDNLTLRKACNVRKTPMYIGAVEVTSTDGETPLGIKFGCSSAVGTKKSSSQSVFRSDCARPLYSYFLEDQRPALWMCEPCYKDADCEREWIVRRNASAVLPCFHSTNGNYVMYHRDSVYVPPGEWAAMWVVGAGSMVVLFVTAVLLYGAVRYNRKHPSIRHPTLHMVFGLEPQPAIVNVNNQSSRGVRPARGRALFVGVREISVQLACVAAIGALASSPGLDAFPKVLAAVGVSWVLLHIVVHAVLHGPCLRSRFSGDPVAWSTIPGINFFMACFEATAAERAAINARVSLGAYRLLAPLALMTLGVLIPPSTTYLTTWRGVYLAAVVAFCLSFAAAAWIAVPESAPRPSVAVVVPSTEAPTPPSTLPPIDEFVRQQLELAGMPPAVGAPEQGMVRV